jgi:outer membrane protein OmpA-like peptidoglycan-associated protein
MINKPITHNKPRTAAQCAYLLLCSLSVAFSVAPAVAEELSHDEMVCALNPECGMPFSNRRVRGITASASVRTPGSFDRTINFEFNAAVLTAQARTELDKVAAALKDPSIEKYPIIIAGHTDGIGGIAYNQGLSQRRAESARQYLITLHGIDGRRLTAKGYGMSQLLLPNDPGNELNRRVQFQNPNYYTAAAQTSALPPASAPTTVTRPVQSEPMQNGM